MKTTSGNIIRIFAVLGIVFKYVATSPTWYTATDGNQYLIEGETKYNWLQANDECSRRDLQLVNIDNSAKNAALDALLRKIFAKSPNLWLGYHDEFNTKKDTNRPFYAISTGKKTSFSNWHSGEPNNVNNMEHCTHIFKDTDYKWNDKPCDEAFSGYICEQNRHATKFIKDNTENHQKANTLNSKVLSEYKTSHTEIEQILELTRTSTDNVLVELNYTRHELIVKSKTSIDDIIRRKPYLAAVIADVGESIAEIIRETFNEISVVSSEARQTIENIHLSAEDSIRGISLDFEDKLENNNNAIDKLFV